MNLHLVDWIIVAFFFLMSPVTAAFAGLFLDQIVYIVNHAENSVIIVDQSLIALLAPILPKLTTVRHFIVIGDASAFPGQAHSYENLLGNENADFAFFTRKRQR